MRLYGTAKSSPYGAASGVGLPPFQVLVHRLAIPELGRLETTLMP